MEQLHEETYTCMSSPYDSSAYVVLPLLVLAYVESFDRGLKTGSNESHPNPSFDPGYNQARIRLAYP